MCKKNKACSKIGFFLLKAAPIFTSVMLMAALLSNFCITYIFSNDAESNLEAVTSLFFTKESFYITFFIFYLIDFVCTIVLLTRKDFFYKVIFIIICFVSSTFMAFSIPDLFSIKLCGYSLELICIAVTCPAVFNVLISIAAGLGFLAVVSYPLFSSVTEKWTDLIMPSVFDLMNVTFIFTMTIICTLLYKYIAARLIRAEDTVQHMNVVMNQLSIINSQIQEYAKTHGEEAVKNERMRITRDMHDSCGYTFVNITAIMDAVMSNPNISKEELSDSLLTVRNLASKGLKEARKTLHSIREIESPMLNNIDAIYETKKIFSLVTGINMKINSGNIKKDYGQTINSIIIHTMQEALTNSVRHGRSKNIYVALWEENDILFMKVEDDGIGTKDIVKGIGLTGMEERISKINGTIDFSSPKQGGFLLKIKIPLLDINNPGKKFEKFSTGEV